MNAIHSKHVALDQVLGVQDSVVPKSKYLQAPLKVLILLHTDAMVYYLFRILMSIIFKN